MVVSFPLLANLNCVRSAELSRQCGCKTKRPRQPTSQPDGIAETQDDSPTEEEDKVQGAEKGVNERDVCTEQEQQQETLLIDIQGREPATETDISSCQSRGWLTNKSLTF